MDISVSELKSKLEDKEDFVLLDVRELYEYDEFNLGWDHGLGGFFWTVKTLKFILPHH